MKLKREEISDFVLEASAEAVQALVCPVCGGSLSIQYTDHGKGALSVLCEKCRWREVSDGIRQEPPWVATLGRKLQTKSMVKSGS
jgi:hypothetical protein